MALPPPDPDPDHWISALRSSHDRLATLVAGLGPDDLRRGSGSSEWSVAQVLSHLGSGAEIALGSVRAAVAGEGPVGRDAMQPIWDRWNAKSPEAMAADALVADAAYVEAMEALDAGARSTVRIKLAFLPEPIDIATAAGFRLPELVLHTWDVAVSLDPDATVAPDAAALLVDRIPTLVAWIGRAGSLGRSDEDPLRVAVVTSAPERRYLLAVGTAVGIEDLDGGAEAAGTLRLPAEAFLRLTAGRLAPPWTPAGVTVEGKVSLDDLRAVFPGM